MIDKIKTENTDDILKCTDSKYRSFFYFIPQFRILMQLEQIIGIAEKDLIVKSLLSESLNPANLKYLFELLTQGHPLL